MNTFHCDACGNLVFFENVNCVECGHALGFLPSCHEISALEPAEDGVWQALLPAQKGRFYKFCANAPQNVCNWMVAAEDPNPFCVSCRLNKLIPDLSLPENLALWQKFETAKHRAIYTLLRLGLPMDGVPEENRPALRFQCVADLKGSAPALTGHLEGLITINIAEADDAERERRRVTFHEPYRTLLGHLRHEIAHYYWDRLIANSRWLADFRTLFGDERADYASALNRYYKHDSSRDWQATHVSAYASAHPWEDWAETGAHYFHIIDMVETAESFGMTLAPPHPSARRMTVRPHHAFDMNMDFDSVLENWFPLTAALNSLNRGMGLLDLYPFALSSAAIRKLRFLHEVVQTARATG